LLAAVGAILRAAPAAGGCSPCLQAARAEYLDCSASATGAFLIARHRCIRREPPCVEACLWQQEVCVADIGAGAALAACASQTSAAKTSCRTKFTLGSKKLTNCIDQAQVAGFNCRYQARLKRRPALVRCQVEFRACSHLCPSGGPSDGVRVCRAAARAGFQGLRSQCKQTFQASKDACLNTDHACAQDCRDTRDACTAPVQATLTAATQACTADQAAAAAACHATYPDGDPALAPCLQTAASNAFLCRDAATQAATPGLAACEQQYVSCAQSCPSAGSSAPSAAAACTWHDPYANRARSKR
jgi:hypothetical protein